MTISEFVKCYYLHDSYFDEVLYDAGNSSVYMKICFCLWMQDDFHEGDPENCLLNVKFTDVSDFSYDAEEIDYDNIGILQTTAEGSRITFALSDDSNNEYHEMIFTARDVTVSMVPLATS